MPVQVLPYVPGFGEQLGQAVAQAAGGLGQGLLNRRAGLMDQHILSSLPQQATPLQQIQAFSRLSPQAQQHLSPLFNHFIQSQGQIQADSQQQSQQQQDVGDILNELQSELQKGRLGVIPLNKLTSKGRESRAYYDELALRVEKELATMVGKGALSKQRFEYLKSRLPSSSDTDATNRGKLRALAKEFKVNLGSSSQKEGPKADFTVVIDPYGIPRRIPSDHVDAALKAGGKLR